MRSKLFSVFVIAILIGGLSVVGCSQKSRGQGNNTRVQGNEVQEQDTKGQWVVVDGERVFVPEFYTGLEGPLRAPEKVARDILRGRKIIKAGQATTTFTTSRAGTELTVDTLEFGPGEPQTRPEQISYVLERVKVFNNLVRESGLPENDSVAGGGTALLIAFKILGRNDALAEAKRRQQSMQELILIDEAYQGRADAEKQSSYEWVAVFAVDGLNELKKARAARTTEEREAAEKKARYYAELINGLMTTGRPTPVGVAADGDVIKER